MAVAPQYQPSLVDPRMLLALGTFGYVLRVILWGISEGSNDIRTWHTFATAVSETGLEHTYLAFPRFNHPPLMGLWSALALYLSECVPLSFAQVFKLPLLIAELGTGLLALWAWRKRGAWRRACSAFAAYGMALSCILISGYHGNTDAAYFFLVFLAAYFIEENQSPFASGLVLGLALNIKLIPLLLILPLASRCTRWRDLLRYFVGGAVGVLPFVVMWIAFEPAGRLAFFHNVFMYRAAMAYWGPQAVFRIANALVQDGIPGFSGMMVALADMHTAIGGGALLLGSAVLAGWNYWAPGRARSSAHGGQTVWDAYELCILGYSLLLVLGAGFGVQYVGAIVAPMLMWSLWGSVWVSSLTGVFILSVYVHYVVTWFPIFSDHHGIGARFGLWSMIAWGSVVWAAVAVMTSTHRPAQEEAG